MRLQKIFVGVFSLTAVVACGVKGRPLPPLNPPPMGDGRLQYQKEAEKRAATRKTRTAPLEQKE